MRDARHELADGRELLGLQQLRLRRLETIDRRGQLGVRLAQLVAHVPQAARRANFFGDVLGDLHHRRAGCARIDRRKRRHAQDLLVGERNLRALGARQRALGAVGRRFRARRGVMRERTANRARRAPAAAQSHFTARHPANRRHRPSEERGERRVAAEQSPVTIEDGDGIADRVERALPLLLAAPHRVVQAGVLNGDDNLAGDDGQQPLIGEVEARGRRCPDAQHAQQIVGNQQRQADAAAHHELGAVRRRDAWRQIFDDDGCASGDDLLARPRCRPIPESLHARRPDRRRHLVVPRPLVAQPNRRADRVKGPDDPLERPCQHIVELQRLADALGDLVDRLELPEETTVVYRHAVDEERSRCLWHTARRRSSVWHVSTGKTRAATAHVAFRARDPRGVSRLAKIRAVLEIRRGGRCFRNEKRARSRTETRRR